MAPQRKSRSEGIDSEAVRARLKHIIEKLNISQSEFSRRIGLNPANLSRYLSGKLPIGHNFINRVAVNIGVSPQWLALGTDIPFPKQLTPTITQTQPIHINTDSQRKGVPVYDIDVTAGCLELSQMLTVDRVLGYVDLPRIEHDNILVRVTGDSMTPVIKPGGFVSIRPIKNTNNIFWGRIYVVVMDDYRMVKYLRRNPNPQKVTLRSANPEFDDMEIDRSDIRGLFLVEAILHCDIQS